MLRFTVYLIPNFTEMKMADFIYRCASDFTGCGYNAASCPIHRGECGKPYFPGYLEPKFNASDSGEYRVCCVGYAECGIDIQRHSLKSDKEAGHRTSRIAARYFSVNEQNKIVTPDDFYDIWSAKESFVKLMGTGIDSHFSEYDTTDPNLAYIKKINFDHNYSLFVSAYGDFELTVKELKI